MSENTQITELSRDFILSQYRMNKDNIIVLFKDLSIPEYLALRTVLQYSTPEVDGTERIYLSDLSEKMKLSMPQISKMAERLNDKGLVCSREKNEYIVSDDRWALEFYFAHKDDSPEALVHAVLTNTEMWGQDLTKIAGLEAKVVEDLKKIRSEGAKAAFKSVI
mgnify:CR=1 FL=1